jgi:hypothetical protein
VWKNIKEKTKIPPQETVCQHKRKQHKTLFNEECLKFVDQRKQAELQCLRDPKRSNADNLNNVRCKNIRDFKNQSPPKVSLLWRSGGACVVI